MNLELVTVDISDTDVVVAAVEGERIDVFAYDLSLDVEQTIEFVDTDDATVFPAQPALAVVRDILTDGKWSLPRFQSTNGKGLKITLGAATNCRGGIWIRRTGVPT